MFYAVHAEVTPTIAPLMARLITQLDRRQELINTYRLISPAIIAQEALSDLAGTGAARFARFRSQAVAFQSDWQSFIIANLFAGKRMTSTDYDIMPRFDWQEEAVQDVAARVATGLAELIAFALVLALIAGKALLGYPIV